MSYRSWQLTQGPPIVDILFSNSLQRARQRFYSLVDVGFCASVGCTAKPPARRRLLLGLRAHCTSDVHTTRTFQLTAENNNNNNDIPPAVNGTSYNLVTMEQDFKLAG